MPDKFVERYKYLLELMGRCIKFLETYPSNFVPHNSSEDEESEEVRDSSASDKLKEKNDAPDSRGDRTDVGEGNEMEQILKFFEMAKPKINEDVLQRRFERISADWPREMFPTYVDCSRVVGSAIHEAAYYHPHVDLDRFSLEDEDFLLRMMASVAGLAPSNQNPLGPMLPFSECISVLLGPQAPDWIAASSNDGPGKLQPHETSRVNWIRLFNMKEQVKIETELQKMARLEPLQSKVVVAGAWTMVAMASFMDAGIFQTEADPHITSLRAGNITLSQGLPTHTVVNFWPYSLIRVVQILREALQDEDLEACDMMWIATSLAKIRSVNSGHKEKFLADQAGPGLFLSHRGMDSKRQLMEAVLRLNLRQHVFLDCLSLPRQMINRHFVFKNLARSERVLIVETANFLESSWCRKEASFAKILARHGICKVTTVSKVDLALKEVERHQDNAISSDTSPATQNEQAALTRRKDGSWTTNRIMTDIDYWARKPNLFSVKEKGLPVTCFRHIEKLLRAAKSEIGSPAEVRSKAIANCILKTYQALLEQLRNAQSIQAKDEAHAGWRKLLKRNKARAPKATNDYSHLFEAPIDLWATAAQYAIAALSLDSTVYNKVETRRYIDASNSLTSEILNLIKATSEEGNVEDRLVKCMILMCAGVALALAGEDYRYVADNGIRQLVDGLALVQDGLLLVDAREQTPQRELLLRLFVLMVIRNDIGSVGLLQDILDPVHERFVDGASLEVMPCVTLHPGMESLFSQMRA